MTDDEGETMDVGRLAVVLGCAVIAVGTVPALGASGDAAHGGAHITISGENRTFAFTAREVDGVDRGEAQLQARQSDTRLHIDVDCLRVVGHRAWVGGEVKHSDDPAVPEGSRSVFVVEDNGEGRNGTPDRLSLVHSSGVGPVVNAFFDCELTTLEPTQEVERGNLQVKPAVAP